MRKILITCTLLLLLSVTAFAQNAGSTYTLDDGSISFTLPNGWVAQDTSGSALLANSQAAMDREAQPGDVYVAVFGNATLDNIMSNANADDLMGLFVSINSVFDESFGPFTLTEEIYEYELNGVTVVGIAGFNNSTGMIVDMNVIPYAENEVAAIAAFGFDAEEITADDVNRIIATIGATNGQSGNTGLGSTGNSGNTGLGNTGNTGLGSTDNTGNTGTFGNQGNNQPTEEYVWGTSPDGSIATFAPINWTYVAVTDHSFAVGNSDEAVQRMQNDAAPQPDDQVAILIGYEDLLEIVNDAGASDPLGFLNAVSAEFDPGGANAFSFGEMYESEFSFGYSGSRPDGLLVDVQIVSMTEETAVAIVTFGGSVEIMNSEALQTIRSSIVPGDSIPDSSNQTNNQQGTNNNTFAGTAEGIQVACQGASDIVNGVEIIVNQMRSGFTYTATAIGIGGFDPVVAVLDETRNGLCDDDNIDAAEYAVEMPSSGFVGGTNTSARIPFNQNVSQFEDVSLVVGDALGRGGEFLLILEGMAVTDADQIGDPFSVVLSPNLLASDVPVTVYMIANVNGFDPLMALVDPSDISQPLVLDGVQVVCDDAGNFDACYGDSAVLSDYGIQRGTSVLPGGPGDAMLQLSLEGASPDLAYQQLIYVMSSYNFETFGEYTLVFHIGVAG